MLVNLYKKSTYMKLRSSWQYEFSMEQIFTAHIINGVIHFPIKLNFPTEDMNGASDSLLCTNRKSPLF